jgi:ABC-type sugar transport system ATPase subunit
LLPFRSGNSSSALSAKAFEVADRIHIHRVGRRIAVIDPAEYSMSDAVAIMTGAMQPRPAPGARGTPMLEIVADNCDRR